MSDVLIKGEAKKDSNKILLKAKKKEGKIPANLYGTGFDNVSLFVDSKELKKAIKSGVKVFSLETESGTFQVITKEVQRHPISWDLLHVDFLKLSDDQKVTIKIPVRYIGEAFGVKNMGGVLLLNSRTVEVSCLPKYILDEIVVDVTELKLHETIHAGDLKLENITDISYPSELLCKIGLTRSAMSEGEDEEGESAEGEESSIEEGESDKAEEKKD